MTDLDPVSGQIVEIASIITDAKLHVIARGPNLVIHQTPETLKKMVNWNQEHFRESGLMEEILESKITLKEAEQATLKFVSQYFQPQKAVLAGNSVYVDREFISIHMPELSAFLHYRIIDVNTVHELALRWFPNLLKFPKNEKHRAMSDNLESIDELKYYKANMFKESHEN
jgi:oligoribonuclease